MFLGVTSKVRDTRTKAGPVAGNGGGRRSSGIETEESCAAVVGRGEAFEAVPAAWRAGRFEVVYGGGRDAPPIVCGGRRDAD